MREPDYAYGRARIRWWSIALAVLIIALPLILWWWW